MKTLKITLIFLAFIQFTNAQLDEKFYFPKKEWKEVKISYSENFISVEKDSIHTAFFQPKTSPKATVLFFHGAGGNISTYMYMIEALVKNEYQVYAVDFRGYGKSSGKPTHLNIVKDVEIVFNKMKENKATKNTKLIVYGASLGCQIATQFTKLHQNEVDALILDGGFASFADVAKLYAPKEAHTFIENALVNIYPSKEEIKEIKNIPKLFIHGKKDKSIPFNQSEIVFKNALEPKEFFISENGHLEALTLETKKVFKQINALITVQ
ncbi:alpha/beta hydrolase [Polaribacter sp. Hel1_85]|uniref:alpha/beta hydrolase n=1 Tax=Polaribacter sp. Hel1_85 TaxID=1250005 RepID=UPI00052CB3E0|nr:alpha/beta fold hydrolase [Polaribacter sp. Hel1_85]KGL64216.1 alpha/beta hydrolase family protein [Polaribacter sp. Hel1_85]